MLSTSIKLMNMNYEQIGMKPETVSWLLELIIYRNVEEF